MFLSGGGSLLPSIYADARYTCIDAVIVSQAKLQMIGRLQKEFDAAGNGGVVFGNGLGEYDQNPRDPHNERILNVVDGAQNEHFAAFEQVNQSTGELLKDKVVDVLNYVEYAANNNSAKQIFCSFWVSATAHRVTAPPRHTVPHSGGAGGNNYCQHTTRARCRRLSSTQEPCRIASAYKKLPPFTLTCTVCGVRCAVCGVRCAVCGVRYPNTMTSPFHRLGLTQALGGLISHPATLQKGGRAITTTSSLAGAQPRIALKRR